ncbi:TPA: hypothetical protein VDU56_006711 [Pseudomonas aeruginosa]|nr:hypothetical protein [Pseudomonas aeruginosa]HBO3576953.1 hypothetical protein [Pseudomonas aeruginosa]HBP1128776.1 hypothetical protein [Pseudomonas aeruginosa]HCR1388143.1 hypothetical protein [Pseudomonas aeruginosa]HEP8785425.1 hypothetical protein [Pseudomonas aeruginosa]
MTKSIAMIAALAALLAGCGKAEADSAAQLVDEARVIYEGRTKGSPGKLPGTFVLGREDVGLCIEQMESAQAKLKQLKGQYPTTEAATSSETRSLEGAVASQLGTCRGIKQQQGW